jgi:hypothetical protein
LCVGSARNIRVILPCSTIIASLSVFSTKALTSPHVLLTFSERFIRCHSRQGNIALALPRADRTLTHLSLASPKLAQLLRARLIEMHGGLTTGSLRVSPYDRQASHCPHHPSKVYRGAKPLPGGWGCPHILLLGLKERSEIASAMPPDEKAGSRGVERGF